MKKFFGKSKKSSKKDNTSQNSKHSSASKKSVLSNLFGSSTPPGLKIHKYARNGDVQKFLLCVAKIQQEDPSGINTVDKSQQTALHIASYEGSGNLVKILVEIKATKVNLFDQNQKTPLMLAVENQFHPVIDELLKTRCDVELKDRAGNTALHLACKIQRV